MSEDLRTTEYHSLEERNKLPILHFLEILLHALDDGLVEFVSQWSQIFFSCPHRMRKVVQYHFNLNQVVSVHVALSEHGLYDFDKHIVGSFLRNRVADHYVKSLRGVKEVLSKHIVDSHFQIIINLDVYAHHVVYALFQLAFLFVIKLSEHIFEKPLIHMLVEEAEDMSRQCLILFGILPYQFFVPDRNYVILHFALCEVTGLFSVLLLSMVLSWSEI